MNRFNVLLINVKITTMAYFLTSRFSTHANLFRMDIDCLHKVDSRLLYPCSEYTQIFATPTWTTFQYSCLLTFVHLSIFLMTIFQFRYVDSFHRRHYNVNVTTDISICPRQVVVQPFINCTDSLQKDSGLQIVEGRL